MPRLTTALTVMQKDNIMYTPLNHTVHYDKHKKNIKTDHAVMS